MFKYFLARDTDKLTFYSKVDDSDIKQLHIETVVII